ncbi:GNAT superfamily N-acetyltransferase [Paenibacillus amylolyticus]|uniref:GNAT superfamily N-acetyltransferase n=1 Tax=Paenibacillus amylolyticus TaxID=1451 RepID=A0AAP5H164_PAEAM|nr:GNAT family N-acetyltransferase [Paenibacillus amylolyticus]MDR6724418.1 GNAT superfamily N-acetyltransferase [Paenibacillus amylolyticus]
MTIRLFQALDMPVVLKMMKDHDFQFPAFIREQYPSRWDSYLDMPDERIHAYYVMLDEADMVIGHAGYILQPTVNRYEIVGVVTCKSHLRQGVAHRLISKICTKITELGCGDVMLYTLDHEKNQAALAFYERMKFQRECVDMNYYTSGFHRLALVKTL